MDRCFLSLSIGPYLWLSGFFKWLANLWFNIEVPVWNSIQLLSPSLINIHPGKKKKILILPFHNFWLPKNSHIFGRISYRFEGSLASGIKKREISIQHLDPIIKTMENLTQYPSHYQSCTRIIIKNCYLDQMENSFSCV